MQKSDIDLSTEQLVERIRELDRRYLAWRSSIETFEKTQTLRDWNHALKAMRDYQWLVRNAGATGWTH